MTNSETTDGILSLLDWITIRSSLESALQEGIRFEASLRIVYLFPFQRFIFTLFSTFLVPKRIRIDTYYAVQVISKVGL